MSDSRDGLAFLLGVTKRLQTMEELLSGPARLNDLKDATDASRFTVSRYLDGFMERGWVMRGDDGYHLTPLGRVVLEEVEGLIDTLEVLENLGDLVRWLPLDDMDFNLSTLSDARITRPTPTDPFIVVRRSTAIYEGADRVWIFTQGFSPEHRDVIFNQVSEGGTVMEMLTTQEIVNHMLSNDDTRNVLQEMSNGGGEGDFRLFAYPGRIPFLMAFTEDTVSIGAVDDNNQPEGTIETSNEKVLNWAHDTFERYVSEAEEVDLHDLE